MTWSDPCRGGHRALPFPAPGPGFFLSNGGLRAERRRKRGCRLLRMEPLSISTDAFGGVHGRIGRFCGRPWSYILVELHGMTS